MRSYDIVFATMVCKALLRGIIMPRWTMLSQCSQTFSTIVRVILELALELSIDNRNLFMI